MRMDFDGAFSKYIFEISLVCTKNTKGLSQNRINFWDSALFYFIEFQMEHN